jgi:hypothetical protein
MVQDYIHMASCSRQCCCQEYTHVPKEVFWFIFNLRMKKKGLVIYMNNHTCYSARHIK